MDNSELQIITEQLRKKKAQARAHLENLQTHARISSDAFFDHLLLQVDDLANPGPNIANPAAHRQEVIAKARDLYRMSNQNPLADTVNEGFHLHGIFPFVDANRPPTGNYSGGQNFRNEPEGGNQATATPSMSSALDQPVHQEKPDVFSVSINKEIESNNFVVAAFQPSGHQVDNVNEVHFEEENGEIVNLGSDKQVAVDDHGNVNEESIEEEMDQDNDLVGSVSDKEVTVNVQDGNLGDDQVEEEAATVSLPSTSTDPKPSSSGQVNYVNMDESTEEGRPPKRHRTRSTDNQQPPSLGTATNLPASFSTMPDNVLDRILNKSGIPLRQQIHLRAVSPRFRDVIEEELQQKTSLSLIVFYYEYQNMGKDDLVIRTAPFNTKMCIQFLGRLFPRVTQMALDSAYLPAWRRASELIRLYATQLQTLKVRGSPVSKTNGKKTVATFTALAETINSIGTLTCLDVKITLEPNVGYYLLPRLKATMSRLNRFICHGHCSFDGESDSHISTSLSPRCTHLRLAIRNFDRFHDPSFAQLAANLTHLHLIHYSYTALQSLSPFTRLSSLTIFFSHSYLNLDYFDSSLLQQLSPLSQLTELNLLNVDYGRLLEAPPSNAFTFPKVKRLNLQLYILGGFPDNVPVASHLLQTLSVWFPNLLHLSFFINKYWVKEIEAIQPNLPYTVTLRKEKFTSKSTFW